MLMVKPVIPGRITRMSGSYFFVQRGETTETYNAEYYRAAVDEPAPAEKPKTNWRDTGALINAACDGDVHLNKPRHVLTIGEAVNWCIAERLLEEWEQEKDRC